MHYMESPEFCGQACHLPMHPQFTAWQAAPHSEVTCTQCHVGEGARALVRAKLAGTRQLYHVLTNQIPKPIPGVADMRPALETCGNCHWPGRDFGDVIKVKRTYADDDANSETATILQMFVGGPGRPTSSGRAIHWHADPDVRIEFVSTDHERQTIPYVRLVGKDGTGQGVQGRGRHRRGDRQRRTAGHGLHRLSQRASASDRADRRAGRRRRDRERQHQPESAVRSPRECPAGQVGPLDAGTRAGRDREGIARLLYRQGRRRRGGARTDDCGGEERVSAQCVSGDEGDVWRLSRQHRTHHVTPGCVRCHDGRTASDGSKINDDCEYCHKQIEPPSGGRP